MLYKVSAVDPAAFLSAILLFPLAAALAMYIPARRASRLEVWEDLR